MKKVFISLATLYVISHAMPLEVVYEERAPYIEKTQHSIQGLVATPALNALKQSGVTYELEEKPSKRHLYEIKSNQKALCALGWFKNPEREGYAKFTQPLYQDEPMGILVRKADKTGYENIDLTTLLQSSNRLLTKASYSYGAFVDAKIKEFNTKHIEVFADNEKMLKLISKKRADYMFISYEEAILFLKQATYKDLDFVSVKAMPEGNNRYMICSQQVDDKIIDLINEKIEK